MNNDTYIISEKSFKKKKKTFEGIPLYSKNIFVILSTNLSTKYQSSFFWLWIISYNHVVSTNLLLFRKFQGQYY